MIRNGISAVLVLLSSSLLAACAATGTTQRSDAGVALHALMDADWDRSQREEPEWASYLGDTRYGNQWTDWSPAAILRRQTAERNLLQQLDAIDATQLSAADRINYALFRRAAVEAVAAQRFNEHFIPVSPINWNGFGYATALARVLSFNNAKDYSDWTERLKRYGTLVDQHIALMRRGMAAGQVPPRITMQRILPQVEAQIVTDAQNSAFYRPFQKMPDSMAMAEQAALRAAGRAAVQDHVVPAWQRFKKFLEQEYLPACRDSIAASDLPDGDAYYAFRVRKMTTTELTPEEIHSIGLSEVQRIRAEMELIRKQVQFKGNLQAFFKHLRSDPKFFHKNPEDLLREYALISKRADAAVVPLFGRLPRMPYGVVKIPDADAPNTTTAYYNQPADDGSRAGNYYVNLYKPETRPRWEMEALSLHEAVPGHHLQIALAQELGELPAFRRLGGYTAFVEGWGLYAESLGTEMGFYQDPYSKFGQLTYEMWRAVRLVVDTGMHAKGWSRRQAIDYFLDNAPKTENDVTVEIDRYIGWPGQALAYKIGELRIKALRARAEQALGTTFDLRGFHDTVLGSGAVTLDVLEQQVDDWITAQRGS